MKLNKKRLPRLFMTGRIPEKDEVEKLFIADITVFRSFQSRNFTLTLYLNQVVENGSWCMPFDQQAAFLFFHIQVASPNNLIRIFLKGT